MTLQSWREATMGSLGGVSGDLALALYLPPFLSKDFQANASVAVSFPQ